MDRGIWWAALHGVAQSRTQLKRLSLHACTGEGNGNPLLQSCLENPRERGAWWAAIYGVTQSQTRLKQLSSNSSSYSEYEMYLDLVLQESAISYLSAPPLLRYIFFFSPSPTISITILKTNTSSKNYLLFLLKSYIIYISYLHFITG